MYPSRVRYEAPHSIEETLDLLKTFGDEAKILAGGQSLIPLLKLRFAAPELLVDINSIPGLDYHREEADGTLSFGALCRHWQLERSQLLRDRQPTMAAAAPMIADPIVRNRGTLIGSVCHADPQGDWASVMLALRGEIIAVSAAGQRSIPASEFVTGPFQNALRPGEFAVEARVPPPQGDLAGTYMKLERRVGDFATVGVAIAIESSGGSVTRAGIALTGVGPSNVEATEAEQALVGSRLDASTVQRAARLAAEAAQPKSDHRGSAEYKRHVVQTFVTRALAARKPWRPDMRRRVRAHQSPHPGGLEWKSGG